AAAQAGVPDGPVAEPGRFPVSPADRSVAATAAGGFTAVALLIIENGEWPNQATRRFPVSGRASAPCSQPLHLPHRRDQRSERRTLLCLQLRADRAVGLERACVTRHQLVRDAGD